MAAVDTLKSDEATAQEEEERKGIISRVMNLDVKVDKGGTRATVVLPGLSYDDFDRTDGVPVHKMDSLLTLSRGRLMRNAQFAQITRVMYEDSLLFTMIVDLAIKIEFYQKVRLHFPLTQSTALTGVGKSSIMFEGKLSDASSGQELISEKNIFVRVDTATRRPIPLPKAMLEQLPEHILKNTPPRFPKMGEPRKEKYIHLVRTAPSDTDYYQHTYRCVYLRYCLDCAVPASLSGYYYGIMGDFAFTKAKHVTILYSGESSPEQDLVVETWQDVCDDLKIFFQILNRQRKIASVIYEIYPQHNKVKSML